MQDPVTLLSLEIVRQRCADESEKYRHRLEYDSSYCLELLRRAILLRDQLAWSYVYEQYHTQVARWVKGNPSFEKCQEDETYFVNGAFARFASEYTPDKLSESVHLGQALNYLKLCVGSTIIDHLRSQKSPETVELPKRVVYGAGNSIEKTVEQRELAHQLWHRIVSKLRTGEERAAIECVFVLHMKGEQIMAQYPHLFPDVQRVYRTLENVLKRLRRDPQLRQWLAEN